MATNQQTSLVTGFSAEDVKNELPEIQVTINGVVITCKTSGRFNLYAQVYNEEKNISFDTPWETVAYCLTNKTPLIYS